MFLDSSETGSSEVILELKMVLILLKPSILLSLLRNNQDLEGGEPLLFIIHTDRHLPGVAVYLS